MIDLKGYVIEQYWHSGYNEYYYCNHNYRLERLDGELQWVIRNNLDMFTISKNIEDVKAVCEKCGMFFLGMMENSHDVNAPLDYYECGAIINSFPYTERDLIHD